MTLLNATHQNLTPDLFFKEEEMKIMKAYLDVDELELKLLEHLENYRKKKNIDRKVSGNEFYNNNLSELELFSKLKINTEQERNNILYEGEILMCFKFVLICTRGLCPCVIYAHV